MSQTISAIYENGVLILDEPLAVSEGSKVEIVVVSKNSEQKKSPAEFLAEIAALPMEGKDEKFSNRDHEKFYMGRQTRNDFR